jgi:hypothetical protein
LADIRLSWRGVGKERSLVGGPEIAGNTRFSGYLNETKPVERANARI